VKRIADIHAGRHRLADGLAVRRTEVFFRKRSGFPVDITLPLFIRVSKNDRSRWSWSHIVGLTRLAITRPLAILMFIVCLVLLGGVSYTKLRQDRFPAISFPAVFVRIDYPGAGPGDVEDLIAKPIENSVAGLPGVELLSSNSSEGSATVNIRFVEGTDTNQAALDVERRLAAVRGRLPVDAGVPSVTKADASAFPIMNIAMSSDRRSLADIFSMANDDILPKLQAVPGVADVQIQGGLQREIQIEVDSARLRAYNISIQTLNNALTRENVSTPGGRINDGDRSVGVRALGQLKTVDDIRNLVISTNPRVVRMADVADVSDTYREQTRLQRFNGNDAVGFTITKQADANGVQVSNDIQKTLAQIRSGVPNDIQMEITSDAASFTRKSISAVQTDLIIAVFLTGLVLFFFLHTWRNTLIVLLAIPTCLISTLLIMFFVGFSINVITLLALALTIGILVDDSIVVLENINRHLEHGENARDASLKGRSEIGLAAIAITLVDVIVFLPVSFMTGNIGRLFKEFGVTIAATTLLSLFVSFTLTPMLASRWLKPGHETGLLARFGAVWERGYDKIARGYRRVLAIGLKLRFAVLGIGLCSLAVSYMMLQTNMIGSEYAPPEDDGLFQVNISMPAGTSLDGTNTVTRRVETILKQIPEVHDIFTSVGGGGGGGGANTRNASIAVQLADHKERHRTVFEVISDFRRLTRGIPDAQIRASVQNPLAGGGGGGIGIRVQGDDLKTLEEVSLRIEEVVRNTAGTVDVQNSASQRDPEIRAVLDRERLADLRISASAAAQALRTSVGGVVVTQLRPDGSDQLDIRVVAKDSERSDIQGIGGIPLLTDTGSIVRLDQVATITSDSGPARIERSERQRRIDINAAVSGRSLGDVSRDIRTALAATPMPEGYRWVLAGQVQAMETATTTLLSTLVLSVILIYMLMVALFESWLTPLAIMFSLPVALVGAFTGLWITGNTFNIFSLIGMIMLMGLVGKNAILLIDFTNTLRARGYERTEALLEAGQTRLRPIVMTTCTVIFAMLPLALKLEAGGETRAPMAVVIIGGVLSSTILTLVLVPGVYTMLDDLKTFFGRLRQPKLAPATVAHGEVAVPDSTAPGRATGRPIRAEVAPPPAQGGSE
jgi:hydrophobic/amphiphilic exporter-1 (mainly G- bacteria), HAE1 family